MRHSLPLRFKPAEQGEEAGEDERASIWVTVMKGHIKRLAETYDDSECVAAGEKARVFGGRLEGTASTWFQDWEARCLNDGHNLNYEELCKEFKARYCP